MPQGEEAVDEDVLSIFDPNSLFDSGHQSEWGDSFDILWFEFFFGHTYFLFVRAA